MRRAMIPTLMSLLLVSGAVLADDGAAGPKFTKVIYPDAVRFVSITSPDGQARTMLFDNFIIATDVGGPTEPDVRMKTFSYVMGVESETDVCVHQDFRGFVARQGAASATLIVHTGGKTTVIDLQQAIAEANKNVINRNDPLRKQAEEAAAKEGFDDAKPEGENDDFFARVSTLVPKGQPLQTTVILLVDRVKADESPQALLTIDSIDSEVFPELKPRR